MKLIARQGDVAIFEVTDEVKLGKEIPRDGGRVILAAGEVTGHHHAIADRGCKLYMDEMRPVSDADAATMIARIGGGLAPDRLLVCDKPVKVQHEEHSTVELKKGTYRIRIQREYHPSELRNVAD